MNFFKVIDNLDSAVNIDTAIANYSLTLIDKDTHAQFLNYIIDSSEALDLPLDFYVSLNNNLATEGNLYLQKLPRAVNRTFDISVLTNNPIHRDICVIENDFINIVEGLDAIGIEWFGEGFYLWEAIFEKARLLNHTDKPSREKSFFLFDNLQDCQYYIDNHKGGGEICQVNITETISLFKADMNWLDAIPNSATFKQAKKYADNYWSGKSSDNPVFEYLFQGKCNLTLI